MRDDKIVYAICHREKKGTWLLRKGDPPGREMGMIPHATV
jgi:hypothetical protein